MKLIKYYIIIITAVICAAAAAAGCITADSRTKSVVLGPDNCVTVFYSADKRLSSSDGENYFPGLEELTATAERVLSLAPSPFGCIYNLLQCFADNSFD